MPPPEVGVVTVTPSAVAVVNELPGRLEGVRTAEVRARVEGIVEKRLFAEGSDVKEGTTLFQIDPRPYADAAAQAEAERPPVLSSRTTQMLREMTKAFQAAPVLEAPALPETLSAL